jgi:hypothetical protein
MGNDNDNIALKTMSGRLPGFRIEQPGSWVWVVDESAGKPIKGLAGPGTPRRKRRVVRFLVSKLAEAVRADARVADKF